MVLLSGDHMAPSASVEILVTLRGSPEIWPLLESKLATQICELPSRLLTKRSCWPSGAHRPRSSPAGPEVSWWASPPARGTTQRCGVFLLSLRLTSTAENNTHFPLGETCGLLILLSDIMSSKVKG